MIGVDEPGNEQECFIRTLIEALASPIVPWKKDIQRDRLSRFLRMSQEEGEVRALLSQRSSANVISAEAGIPGRSRHAIVGHGLDSGLLDSESGPE
jgi:hypothetical protein